MNNDTDIKKEILDLVEGLIEFANTSNVNPGEGQYHKGYKDALNMVVACINTVEG